jgi:porin
VERKNKIKWYVAMRNLGKSMRFLGVCLAMSGVSLEASAQNTGNTTLDLNLNPYSAQDESSGAVESESPLAISRIGQELWDQGVYFTIRYTGEAAANPSGGQRQGTAYAGDLNYGVTLDLQKLMGLHGALIHILFNDRSGSELSDQTINTSLPVQNLFGFGETWQLGILTYEQKLFHDKVNVVIGRTEIAFLTSPFYCDFQSHGDCGRPFALTKNISANVYPEGIWGGRILVQPTQNVYAKVGLYQPNPDDNPALSHGFDFGIKNNTGVLVPVEVGYKHMVPGAVAPDQYDIGYFASAAPYTASFHDASDPNFSNRDALYLQAQKMVYQTISNSKRGVYLFGFLFFPTSGSKQQAKFSMSAGVSWQGPFASRPDDSFDFMGNEYLYNREFIQQEFESRLKEGGSGRPDRSQAALEADYIFQANSWLQIQPNVQYIFNPDGLGFTPFPKENLPNAFVVGLQFTIDVPSLFGVPSYPFPSVQDN